MSEAPIFCYRRGKDVKKKKDMKFLFKYFGAKNEWETFKIIEHALRNIKKFTTKLCIS